MTIDAPRCPALHPDLPYARCRREEGHGAPHRTFTDLEWENTMHPDGRLTWNNRDDAEGGVTAAAIEKEAEGAANWDALTIHLMKRHEVERERDDALAMAALWKETARRLHQYRILARAGREFYRDVAAKSEEFRDEAHRVRDTARGHLRQALIELQEQEARAEKAEQERYMADMTSEGFQAEAAHWKERAKRAETALADVHERDETVARLEQRLTEAEYHRYSWKSAALRAEQALAEVGLTPTNPEEPS